MCFVHAVQGGQFTHTLFHTQDKRRLPARLSDAIVLHITSGVSGFPLCTQNQALRCLHVALGSLQSQGIWGVTVTSVCLIIHGHLQGLALSDGNLGGFVVGAFSLSLEQPWGWRHLRD